MEAWAPVDHKARPPPRPRLLISLPFLYESNGVTVSTVRGSRVIVLLCR